MSTYLSSIPGVHKVRTDSHELSQVVFRRCTSAADWAVPSSPPTKHKVLTYACKLINNEAEKGYPLVDSQLSLLDERRRSARNPVPKHKNKTKQWTVPRPPNLHTCMYTYLYLNIGHLHAQICTHVNTYICISMWKDTRTHAL